jgi:hypothetical protein
VEPLALALLALPLACLWWFVPGVLVLLGAVGAPGR